jgi:hypothetical protein
MAPFEPRMATISPPISDGSDIYGSIRAMHGINLTTDI